MAKSKKETPDQAPRGGSVLRLMEEQINASREITKLLKKQREEVVRDLDTEIKRSTEQTRILVADVGALQREMDEAAG